MNEMVERVARAIQNIIAAGDEPVDEAARFAARAAIEAMREPTEPMVKAGEATSCEHGELQCGAKRAYGAMIDAALTDA